jgi:hypothetical protein
MVDLRGPGRRRAGSALLLQAELFIFSGAEGMSILVVLSISGKNSRAQLRRSRPLIRNPEHVHGAER